MTRRKQVGESCSKCKRTDVEFYDRCADCKQCRNAASVRRKIQSYRISHADYADLLARQSGRCAICQTDDWGANNRPCIDHDHQTLEVRGLLCRRCNIGIGMLGDSAEVVAAALAYLKRS